MKIALIGSAPSSVALGPYRDQSFAQFQQGKVQAYPPAPYADESWEIWACSPGAFGVVERCTRFFELHRWEPGQPWFSPEYCQFLREFRGPVYTGGPVEELANGVVYPIDEVEAEFSAYFLTSSLALMLALAILEIEAVRRSRKAAAGLTLVGDITPTPALVEPRPAVTDSDADDVIGLWGVDMAATEEWASQRPGCHFFVLEALRRGIGVYVPPESDLLRPMPVYGISEWDHSYIKATARMRELNARKNDHQARLGEHSAGLQFLSGATDNMNYMIQTWFSPYGIPAGKVIRLDPDSPGLGGGVTLPRPFSPPPEAVHALGLDTPGAA